MTEMRGDDRGGRTHPAAADQFLQVGVLLPQHHHLPADTHRRTPLRDRLKSGTRLKDRLKSHMRLRDRLKSHITWLRDRLKSHTQLRDHLKSRGGVTTTATNLNYVMTRYVELIISDTTIRFTNSALHSQTELAVLHLRNSQHPRVSNILLDCGRAKTFVTHVPLHSPQLSDGLLRRLHRAGFSGALRQKRWHTFRIALLVDKRCL